MTFFLKEHFRNYVFNTKNHPINYTSFLSWAGVRVKSLDHRKAQRSIDPSLLSKCMEFLFRRARKKGHLKHVNVNAILDRMDLPTS